MRLIDADALKEYATGGVTSVGLLTLAEIDNAPTIDAVPVVRCKDCKHTDTDGCKDPAIYCKVWDRWEMPEDGFCSYGERRSDG